MQANYDPDNPFTFHSLTTNDFLVLNQCQPYLYLGNFSRKPHYYTVKRTKLQGNTNVPRFFANKSKSASSSFSAPSSSSTSDRQYDFVVDFKNLLIKSGASLQSMVEKAARLNGIFDKELVNDALVKVTGMLSGMRDVHVTLEEPVVVQIGRSKSQNYKLELSLGATQSNQT